MVESGEPPIGETTALNSQLKTLNFFKKPGARIFARSTSFETDL